MKKYILSLLLLMALALQSVSAQGFRVYKSDGTVAQFSFRTDSIVFYEGIGTDEEFGPYTPVNQCIAGTWYKSKSQTVTFNADGTTDYMEGATYEFMPYQGIIVIYNASAVPMSILKVYKLTKDKMFVSQTGDSQFKVWATTPQPQAVEEIILSETSVSLQLDERVTLTATVLPEDADDKTVTWESSNEDVAEVNRSGRVTANADGTCIITCRAADGSGVYAECQVTVGGDVPDEHEWVDLGLPSGTLWATCNIGADSPEEFGWYYAWGETTPKTYYSWSNYKWCKGTEETITKYNVTGKNWDFSEEYDILPEDDAATVNWGSGWQMPRKDQYYEAFVSGLYTTSEWTSLNGVPGVKITSNSNNNSIFIPASGYVDGSAKKDVGKSIGCWSGSLFYNKNAFVVTTSGEADARCHGRCIRPVRVKSNSSNYVTSIALSESSLTITPNETRKLTATVLPANANNKTVRWESSNASVASVENDGTVKGKAKGTCVIKCSATDGSGKYAECQVTVEEETDGTHGTTDGHEWVDLGLPSGTLWATCNVGANNPEDAGNLYAWGETSTKSTFSWSNYKYCKGTETTLTKYCGDSSYGYNGFTDGKTSLDATDDAASVNWSSKWQMPSIEQAEELQNYTTMENVQVNGKKARKIKSKSNANSILLPADMNDDSGYFGIYWSRSLEEGYDGTARGFLISWDDTWIISGGWWRYESMHVRPVRKQ